MRVQGENGMSRRANIRVKSETTPAESSVYITEPLDLNPKICCWTSFTASDNKCNQSAAQVMSAYTTATQSGNYSWLGKFVSSSWLWLTLEGLCLD